MTAGLELHRTVGGIFLIHDATRAGRFADDVAVWTTESSKGLKRTSTSKPKNAAQ